MRATSSRARDLQNLESALRAIGEAREFLTLHELALQMGLSATDGKVPRLFTSKAFRDNVLLVHNKNLDSPIAAKSDAERFLQSEALLRFAVRLAEQKKVPPLRAKDVASATSLPKEQKSDFQQSLVRRIRVGEIPADCLALLEEPLSLTDVVNWMTSRLASMTEPLVTVDEFVSQCRRRLDDPLTKRALASKVFKEESLLFGKGRAVAADALLARRAQWARAAESPRLRDWAFAFARSAARSKGYTALRIADLVRAIPAKPADLRLAFRRSFERSLLEQNLPPMIASIRDRAGYILFHLDDAPIPNGKARSSVRDAPTALPSPPEILEPLPNAALGDFDARFDQAFDRCNRDAGARNFVKLLALRQALPEIDRTTFDAGLRRLRDQRFYTLESSEGNEVRLSDAEREAALVERGVPLVYASRRPQP